VKFGEGNPQCLALAGLHNQRVAVELFDRAANPASSLRRRIQACGQHQGSKTIFQQVAGQLHIRNLEKGNGAQGRSRVALLLP